MAYPHIQLVIYLLFDEDAAKGLQTSNFEWLEDNAE